MHFFLYEWITGGGLVEEPGQLPPSLLTEGEAMLVALATDFVALPDAKVTVLRDARLDAFQVSRCEVIEVHSREHLLEELIQLASLADHTLLIAPEFDSILIKTTRQVRSAGGKLLNASQEFIAIASDKHLTAEHLARSGVRVPEAIWMEPDAEKLPPDFPYPAVLKPINGAGSQDTYLVHSHRDEPPGHPWPRRLERFQPGIPASVSFLCGPQGCTPLPACRQHLTEDGRLGYLGGSLLWETELAERATLIATQALKSIPGGLGYIGVDLVLGKASDGTEDVVIEINPRLTTSYVGLRAMTEDNLASAMLRIAAGKQVALNFKRDPLEFSAAGMVRRPF
ncbi:ATP-grasp domain-containing protein [Bythopirellula polymerisocia]|uniref:Carbamoyl phosphate synthase-like protein n=1 Tax=Bythopirellula polymerisocia TaxID=2528003 RepID=A0A5C6CB61_9BACT|nr:ATP-grasp domain-containing protein [Bythopirellula polymerisocia]TWU20059.1 carbamoyl phosphate synthase-like protein [Bythopirellula polymerisocia]